MEKVTCDVIRDLLPLYVEDCASKDSCVLIEEHLSQCQECVKELEMLKKPLPFPIENDTVIMKKINKKQRRRTLVTILVSVLICSLVIGSIVFITAKDLAVTYNSSDFTVEETEDGQIKLQLSDRAKGAFVHMIYQQDENGETTMYLSLDDNLRVLNGLYRLISFQWFEQDIYEDDVPLKLDEITWVYNGVAYGTQEGYRFQDVLEGTVGEPIEEENPDEFGNGFTEMSSGGLSNYSFTESFIVDDSVTKIYYQPNMDEEWIHFCDYIDETMNKAFELASKADDWEGILQALCSARSEYLVPESNERELIWEMEE